MTTFVTVGAGWRAEYFWRAAEGLPELECVGAVVPSHRPLVVSAFTSLRECVRATRPDFAVAATPKAVTPTVVAELVRLGVPVLAETPPAPDLGGLSALWSEVGASGLVQVAEQYLLMPSHAARAALVRSGTIGLPTQVQVSSTHDYHAVSLMRGLLGIGRGPVSVTATRTTAPLVDPADREGWTEDPDPTPATTTIATIDFGEGRRAVRLHRQPVAQPAAVPPHPRARLARRAQGRRGDPPRESADRAAHAVGTPADGLRPGPGRVRDRAHRVRHRRPVPQPLPGAPVERRGGRHRHAAGADGGLGARRRPTALPARRRRARPPHRPALDQAARSGSPVQTGTEPWSVDETLATG